MRQSIDPDAVHLLDRDLVANPHTVDVEVQVTTFVFCAVSLVTRSSDGSHRTLSPTPPWDQGRAGTSSTTRSSRSILSDDWPRCPRRCPHGSTRRTGSGHA